MKRAVRLSREVGNTPPRQKFYIFCEGENTEPAYIEEYNIGYCRASVEIIFVGAGDDPSKLVWRAEQKQKETSKKSYRLTNGDRDQIWVMFDRDEHEHFDAALEKAESIGINVALSNPCFELWLILHCADYSSSQDRHELQRECESICPGYTRKHRKIPDLSKILPSVSLAEERAQRLRRQCAETGTQVPFTTVDELTRSLRQARGITGYIFNVCVIDCDIILEATGHSDEFTIDIEGVNSKSIVSDSSEFIQARAAALGEQGPFRRTRDIGKARFVVAFMSEEEFGGLPATFEKSELGLYLAFSRV